MIQVPLQLPEEILIPILFDNTTILESFGFDLEFPDENLEFLAIDDSEFVNKFSIIDANVIRPGVVRVGGFSSAPIVDSDPMIIVLVFREKTELLGKNSVRVLNAVDDVAEVKKTYRRFNRGIIR